MHFHIIQFNRNIYNLYFTNVFESYYVILFNQMYEYQFFHVHNMLSSNRKFDDIL